VRGNLISFPLPLIIAFGGQRSAVIAVS